MKKIKTNPYREIPFVSRRRITGHISEEDFQYLRRVYPLQGVQQEIVSTLVHAFIEALKQTNVKEYYEQRNSSVIEELLRGVSFPQVD